MSMTSLRPYNCWLWTSKCRLNVSSYLIIDLFVRNQLHFMKLSMRGKNLTQSFSVSLFFVFELCGTIPFSYYGVCTGVSFNKDAGLQPETFLNKRLPHSSAFIGKYGTEKPLILPSFMHCVIWSEIISPRNVTWFRFFKQSSISCLEKILNILLKCQKIVCKERDFSENSFWLKIHPHHLLNLYFLKVLESDVKVSYIMWCSIGNFFKMFWKAIRKTSVEESNFSWILH